MQDLIDRAEKKKNTETISETRARSSGKETFASAQISRALAE